MHETEPSMIQTLVRFLLFCSLASVGVAQSHDTTAGQPKRVFAVVFLYRGSVVGNNAGAGGLYVRTGDTTWAKLTRSNVYSFGVGYHGGASTPRHYLAGGNGVHRSTDGGQSWRILTTWRTEEILGVVPDPVDSAVIYAATPLGVFKSSDDGATWVKKMNGFKKWFIQRIIMDRDDRNVLYAASEDDLYRTTDGGEHWTPLRVGAPEILSVLQHPARPEVMVVGLEDRAIRYSIDRGRTWKAASVPSKTTIYCLGASADGRDLYAGGWESGLWRSEDHGATWSPVWKAEGIEAIYWIFVHPDDASHLLVATAGAGIWESRDRGLTWRQAGLNGAQVKQIELYP